MSASRFRGGFAPADLERRLASVGCRAWFRPTGVLLYLATRAAQIFATEGSRLDLGRRRWLGRATEAEQVVDAQQLVWPYRPVLEALARADDWLERFPVVRDNRMRLIWGFEKSASDDAVV